MKFAYKIFMNEMFIIGSFLIQYRTGNMPYVHMMIMTKGIKLADLKHHCRHYEVDWGEGGVAFDLIVLYINKVLL